MANQIYFSDFFQINPVLPQLAAGPFNTSIMSQMVFAGVLTKNSLVWKQGMPDWVKADTVQDLKSLLNSEVPPIPDIPPIPKE